MILSVIVTRVLSPGDSVIVRSPVLTEYRKGVEVRRSKVTGVWSGLVIVTVAVHASCGRACRKTTSAGVTLRTPMGLGPILYEKEQ